MQAKFCLVLALLATAGLLAGREYARRIVLRHGQTNAVFAARIPAPGDSVVFSFSARAGQNLSVHLKPQRNLVAQAVLIYPSGQQDGPGTDLTASLKEAGNYKLRIMGREQTSGTFRLAFGLR
jgi:hypothetical protein